MEEGYKTEPRGGRPPARGITLVAAGWIVLGVLGVQSTSRTILRLGTDAKPVFLLALAFDVLFFLAWAIGGVGALQLQRWAWPTLVTCAGLSLLFTIAAAAVSVFEVLSSPLLVLAYLLRLSFFVLTLIVLLRANVRAAFGRDIREAAPEVGLAHPQRPVVSIALIALALSAGLLTWQRPVGRGVSSAYQLGWEDELAARALFSRGLAHSNNGDLNSALADYSEAIHLKRDFAPAFSNRGTIRALKGDFQGALADFDEAIRLQPNFPDAFNNRGLARAEHSDLDGALADFDEAIRLKPDSSDSFNNRGNARADKGDFQGALADFDEAIRLQPGDALVYLNRGLTRKHEGEMDGALSDFDLAIRLQPDSADAFNSRGAVRAATGDLAAALSDFDEAIRLQPDHARAFYNRGVAHAQKGQMGRALADFDRAIQIDPDLAEARRNRALLLKLRGQRLDGRTARAPD